MQYNSLRWIEEYQKKGAYWLHDGNKKRPHALLTSGLHSGGFFNSGLVAEDPFLLDYACGDMVQLLEQQGVRISKIDRVVGPAMGAITIAHDVTRHIRTISGRPCFSSYTEKGLAESENGRMLFRRTSVKPGETVLLVEDVVTTGDSVNATSKAVADAGGIILPFVLAIVNRSGLFEVGDKKIIAIIDQPMPSWTSRMCPLCKMGSEAIRPKEKDNWARLNAAY